MAAYKINYTYYIFLKITEITTLKLTKYKVNQYNIEFTLYYVNVYEMSYKNIRLILTSDII